MVFPTADQMSKIEFWQRLLPEFHISEQPFRSEKAGYEFSEVEADYVSRQISKEGYFQSAPIIPAHDLKSLVNAIVRIHESRIMPPFIAIFDEFWQLWQGLRNTFDPILGKSYRLVPDYWAWHIEPNAASRGWIFHRDASIDRPFDAHAHMHEDRRPKLCTVWIPLTDATTHNSCIYVLPFPHDPAIQSFLRKESMAQIQQHSQSTDWTNVRALPAQAGSLLGWNPYIVHWGSRSTEWAMHPRISLATYYEAADSPTTGRPFDPEGRRFINVHDPDCRLSFGNRLTIIANLLAIYVDKGQMVNEPNFSTAVTDFCQRWKNRNI